jgi:hypothetical protein
VIKLLLRLLIIGIVGFFLLVLYRPDFVAKAGNALLNGNNGNVVGSAQLLPDTQGKGSSLQVSLQGLTSRSHYVVTLDQGSCGGKVLATMGSVTADGQGNALATIDKSNLDATVAQGVWVDVHQNSASGPSVACGRVQINSATTTQQSGTGTATYTVPIGGTAATPVHNTTNTTQSPSTSSVGGFPQTGAAPDKDNSYDNYTFPRKY